MVGAGVSIYLLGPTIPRYGYYQEVLWLADYAVVVVFRRVWGGGGFGHVSFPSAKTRQNGTGKSGASAPLPTLKWSDPPNDPLQIRYVPL
ncbi:uncharacterized protein YALI1_E26790g [Yarrowia lipolytica]|uniref:Uncharacterized protein n=1 Tax=Yarrowia lipolytica TaxID=4952 RepID=A0A1D8NJI7_YARLL|nr:hypothetical protein YALI1_E26790g [Yarrowia lipolytica]